MDDRESGFLDIGLAFNAEPGGIDRADGLNKLLLNLAPVSVLALRDIELVLGCFGSTG